MFVTQQTHAMNRPLSLPTTPTTFFPPLCQQWLLVLRVLTAVPLAVPQSHGNVANPTPTLHRKSARPDKAKDRMRSMRMRPRRLPSRQLAGEPRKTGRCFFDTFSLFFFVSSHFFFFFFVVFLYFANNTFIYFLEKPPLLKTRRLRRSKVLTAHFPGKYPFRRFSVVLLTNGIFLGPSNSWWRMAPQ